MTFMSHSSLIAFLTPLSLRLQSEAIVVMYGRHTKVSLWHRSASATRTSLRVGLPTSCLNAHAT